MFSFEGSGVVGRWVVGRGDAGMGPSVGDAGMGPSVRNNGHFIGLIIWLNQAVTNVMN